MDVSQMAMDAMAYVREIGGILMLIGGIAFADLTIGFLIKHFKQIRSVFR